MHWSTAASVSYQQFSIQNHFNFFSATFDFLSIFKNEESLSLSFKSVQVIVRNTEPVWPDGFVKKSPNRLKNLPYYV
jgi:hypothetical protein